MARRLRIYNGALMVAKVRRVHEDKVVEDFNLAPFSGVVFNQDTHPGQVSFYVPVVAPWAVWDYVPVNYEEDENYALDVQIVGTPFFWNFERRKHHKDKVKW